MNSSVNLEEYNKCSYSPEKSKIVIFLWRLTSLLIFESSLFPFYKIKAAILRLFGAQIGKNVIIKPSVKIKYPWKLSIGDNSWIGEKVWIDNLGQADIGKNVCISQSAMLLCGNHDYKKFSFDLIVKNIKIEDGAWVCAKAVVCPGVTLRNHSMLTVGSVAVSDLEPFGIYCGNKATKIKDRVIA